MTFRTDINGLRAVAVLLVVLFHLRAPGLDGGFVGVDVFFVISGFLMTRIAYGRLDAGAFSLGRFYRDRAVRIVPALAVMVAASLLFGVAFVDPEALQAAARHGLSALLFLSNLQFWTESGYFDPGAENKWFLHTWSLSVEWQFYLLFPVVLLAMRRFTPTRPRRAALLAAGLVVSLGLAVACGLHPSARVNSLGFFMLPARAWEMLAGGLVAVLARPGLAGAARRGWLEAAGLLVLAVAVLAFDGKTPWPSFWALVPVAGAAMILAAEAPRSLLRFGPLQAVGRASYSIYLWHWPLVAALAYFEIASPGARVAAFGLSLVLGWASYRLVEQPFVVALRHARPRAGLTGAAAFAGVALGAVFIGQAGGLPGRVAGDAALYVDASQADDDRAFPAGCGGLSPIKGELRACAVGAPSQDEDVIVLGDSFAEMWFSRAQALRPQLTRHAVVFATKSGCPPIDGVERVAPGFNCAAFNDVAFREAAKPRYKTVVIASMWTSHFRASAAAIDTDARTGLQRLAADVDRLRQAGKTVVVLTTTPYPGEDVTRRIKLRAFQGKPVDPHWSFDFARVASDAAGVEEALEGLRARGVIVVNTAAALCGGAVCPVMEAGRPIYSDGGHLRASFTARRGGFLDQAFLGGL